MTEDTASPPPSPTAFSWKPPQNYIPKKNYYADLVTSYSALTDIINPTTIECDYSDVRALDGMMMEQATALHKLAESMLNDVRYSDGSVCEQKLMMALRTQRAFRDSFVSANLTLVRRYMASNIVL